MRGASVTILLWLLPSQVNGLITTDAKCLSGYELGWAYSSIGQSPCDVAAELATVCVGRIFNLKPLGTTGIGYLGPAPEEQNECRCSSVYYSLLSACSFCQGGLILPWSIYKSNCTAFYLAVYTRQIPDGVKVPAYAYQDVSVSNVFNPVLAQSMATQTNSGKSGTVNNTPAIVGGVVGGVVGLGLIASLVIFLVLRSRQKTQKHNSSSQLDPMSPTRGTIYNPDDRIADPNLNSPNRSTFVTSSDTTRNSVQNYRYQDSMSKNLRYSGVPEL